MHVYKQIERSDISLEKTLTHYEQLLNTGSEGLSFTQFVSGSISESYWRSLNVLFYTSGSPTLNESNSTNPDIDNYDTYGYNFSIYNPHKPQYLNKFHNFSTGSIFSISQIHYGDTIKRKSFELTDNSHPSSSIILTDDGYGNLYAPSASISQSNNSLTSSDNYVGNIFYDWGFATIIETGSYSHTPSTASVSVGIPSNSYPSSNRFFVTGSDLLTSIEFISTGSYASETDTTSKYYFGSGSTTTNTAISGTRKINEVFDGGHISASSTGNVITMSNDANLLVGRRPLNSNDNLGAISGANSMTGSGFGGGKAAVNYTDIGTNYDIKFKSTEPIYTQEYLVKIEPNEYNYSMNYSLRCFPSSSNLTMPENSASFLSNPWICSEYTSSDFQPYITSIALYNKKNVGGVADPVIVANLPRPLMISKATTVTLKIKLDR
tara:strand:+ start:6404 stop:7711 length:1308 start_codon:yes stop_codon:yes gene_type:complete